MLGGKQGQVMKLEDAKEAISKRLLEVSDEQEARREHVARAVR